MELQCTAQAETHFCESGKRALSFSVVLEWWFLFHSLLGRGRWGKQGHSVQLERQIVFTLGLEPRKPREHSRAPRTASHCLLTWRPGTSLHSASERGWRRPSLICAPYLCKVCRTLCLLPGMAKLHCDASWPPALCGSAGIQPQGQAEEQSGVKGQLEDKFQNDWHFLQWKTEVIGKVHFKAANIRIGKKNKSFH